MYIIRISISAKRMLQKNIRYNMYTEIKYYSTDNKIIFFVKLNMSIFVKAIIAMILFPLRRIMHVRADNYGLRITCVLFEIIQTLQHRDYPKRN